MTKAQLITEINAIATEYCGSQLAGLASMSKDALQAKLERLQPMITGTFRKAPSMLAKELETIANTVNALWGPAGLTFEAQIGNLLDAQTEMPVVYMAQLKDDQKSATQLALANFPDDAYHNAIVTAAHDLCTRVTNPDQWFYYTGYASGASGWRCATNEDFMIIYPNEVPHA